MLTIGDWGRLVEQVQQELMPLSNTTEQEQPETVIDRKRFTELLCASFDLEEFRSLCVNLDIGYDDLRGETLRRNIEELIMKLQRQDRLLELIELVREERPNAPWDDIFPSNN